MRGGKREGAGKKKGQVGSNSVAIQELKAQFIASYTKRRELIDAKLFEEAEKGNVPAIKEIYDRVYGKAPQDISMTLEDRRLIADDGDD